jgi:hypothetical protein
MVASSMNPANDLFILNVDSPQEIQDALEEFKRRSVSVVAQVFSRSIDVQRDFSNWFDEFVKNTNDSVMILHDEPLYVVARYLGLDPNNLSDETLNLAEKLATAEHWY